jgi:nucleotide sugar dehydrogenase
MIGAGYVGLVSGACFADFGHQVNCIDKDATKIAALKRGEIPIFEPGLAELVESNVRQGRLEFATEASGIGEAEAIFIAVGTPSRRGDGHADLSFVYQAVREIAPQLSSATIVITKSTVVRPRCHSSGAWDAAAMHDVAHHVIRHGGGHVAHHLRGHRESVDWIDRCPVRVRLEGLGRLGGALKIGDASF